MEKVVNLTASWSYLCKVIQSSIHLCIVSSTETSMYMLSNLSTNMWRKSRYCAKDTPRIKTIQHNLNACMGVLSNFHENPMFQTNFHKPTPLHFHRMRDLSKWLSLKWKFSNVQEAIFISYIWNIKYISTIRLSLDRSSKIRFIRSKNRFTESRTSQGKGFDFQPWTPCNSNFHHQTSNLPKQSCPQQKTSTQTTSETMT